MQNVLYNSCVSLYSHHTQGKQLLAVDPGIPLADASCDKTRLIGILNALAERKMGE